MLVKEHDLSFGDGGLFSSRRRHVYVSAAVVRVSAVRRDGRTPVPGVEWVSYGPDGKVLDRALTMSDGTATLLVQGGTFRNPDTTIEPVAAPAGLEFYSRPKTIHRGTTISVPIPPGTGLEQNRDRVDDAARAEGVRIVSTAVVGAPEEPLREAEARRAAVEAEAERLLKEAAAREAEMRAQFEREKVAAVKVAIEAARARWILLLIAVAALLGVGVYFLSKPK